MVLLGLAFVQISVFPVRFPPSEREPPGGSIAKLDFFVTDVPAKSARVL
jgi:hypothetical protein